MKNYFDTFALPQSYHIDLTQLNTAFLLAQNEVHPDKFTQASEQEKRLSLQLSTHLNQAFQTLKHPLKRASYLCELHGFDLNTHSNTAMPSQFLMQQIQWREQLAQAQTKKQLDVITDLENEVQQSYQQELSRIAHYLEKEQYEKAAEAIRINLFLEKFLVDISHTLEVLEN